MKRKDMNDKLIDMLNYIAATKFFLLNYSTFFFMSFGQYMVLFQMSTKYKFE